MSKRIEDKSTSIRSLCPRSSKGSLCPKCQVIKDGKNWLLKCHCGKGGSIVLRDGRVQSAKRHWEGDKCEKITTDLKTSIPISAYFSKRPTDSDTAKPVPKAQIHEVACCGNTDKTWLRGRAKTRLTECIDNSPSTYHGGRPQHELCLQLFNTTCKSSLSETNKQLLQATVVKEATWEIRRHDRCRSIHSIKCSRRIPARSDQKHPVCDHCQEVRKDRSLLAAVNMKYADDDSIKFVRKDLMAADPFQEKRCLYEQVNLLAKSLERATKQGDQNFWKVFAAQAEAGKFDDHEPFIGLVMAVAIRNEREKSGKALTGVPFASGFDDFMMTLAAISPRGALLFRETFAGRSLRSQRHIQAKNSLQLADGLALVNFKQVSSILEALNYTGPLAVGSDQTVCLKSLRAHDGFLVGAQGGDIKFNSEEDLKKITEHIIINKSFCSKLRAYTIQVPLPGIPTYVVALLASNDKENATEIIETHRQVLQLCNQADMKILSISSDGAVW
ncbi:hypothetical protein H4Q26_006630 [Puccinia striiformis f. sp. tritici PST-130]|nr:hypothetical protein H4Q26_006630 [Puccinia striiformis f. sp. tritici PST-130]